MTRAQQLSEDIPLEELPGRYAEGVFDELDLDDEVSDLPLWPEHEGDDDAEDFGTEADLHRAAYDLGM